MTFDPADGVVVQLSPDAQRHGPLLIGGSPTTVLRLAPRALELIGDGRLAVDSAATAAVADRLVAASLAWPEPDSLPTASLDELTVVVPVKERAAELGRLLSALDGQVRVIVVDDGSTDGRAIAGAAERHGARLIRLEVNRGPAAARNAGLAEATTAFVAFVDSDVTVVPAALALALRHFADSAVALVAPRVRGARVPRGRWFERYEQESSSLDRGRLAMTVRPYARVAWLPSACLLARVDAIGIGFDESLRAGEDVDLTWRVLRDGHRVVYEPAALAEHDSRATFGSWFARKAFYGTSAAALHRRHGSLVAPAVLDPLHLVAIGAVGAQRRWSIPVVAVAWAASAVRVGRSLPETSGRSALAARLAAQGLGVNADQVSALALRHHWPLALLVALVSRRARRAIAVAAVVDGLRHRSSSRSPLGAVSHLLTRRIDDLAYGTGLWIGAIRDRELGALRPRIQRPRFQRRQ